MQKTKPLVVIFHGCHRSSECPSSKNTYRGFISNTSFSREHWYISQTAKEFFNTHIL